MPNVAYWVILSLLALALVYLLARIGRAYFKLRGERLVTCPETQKPAAVTADVKHGMGKAAFGTPHFRLSECSRWPERQGCGQECLKQIELAPEGCLVRTIVTKWYAGKTCAICGRLIHEVEWMAHHPALQDPDHKTVDWHAISPEKLPEVFETYSPVCWDCHVAETLRREHPDLVLERPWRRGR